MSWQVPRKLLTGDDRVRVLVDNVAIAKGPQLAIDMIGLLECEEDLAAFVHIPDEVPPTDGKPDNFVRIRRGRRNKPRLPCFYLVFEQK